MLIGYAPAVGVLFKGQRGIEQPVCLVYQRTSSELEISGYAIERIARCMLLMLQQYYKSEEGQRELAEWEKPQEQK